MILFEKMLTVVSAHATAFVFYAQCAKAMCVVSVCM